MEVKKITIVGQPMYNIGDVAACKALVKLIKEKYNCKIDLLFFENTNIDEEFRNISDVKISKSLPVVNKYQKLIRILFPKLYHFFSFNKNDYKLFSDSDFVLVAPGGLEFGLYKEWNYLWILSLLVGQNKYFGIYSRSIGDFREKSFNDRLFKQQTVKYLKLSKFNGLRDSRSQKSADDLQIPFFPSIDVVFSSKPDFTDIDRSNFLQQISGDYIVFTPSAFDWHPKYTKYDPIKFTELYLEILNTVLKSTDLKIVMLPHIYKENNDEIYFDSLIEKCSQPARVFVLRNNYNSDLYQYIVSQGKLSIIFRLHQTIFAVNNHIPFISVSYEHKMVDMMSILGLQKNMVNLEDLLEGRVNISNVIKASLTNNEDNSYLITAQQNANKIAMESFNSLTGKIAKL